jgi:hypothetical protein
VALAGLALISSIIVSMSFIGVTVKEAYTTLLDLSVVLQMLSFLYLYASLLAVAMRGGAGRFGRQRIWFAAVSGLVTTTLGGIVAFVPSHQINSIWIFELKMVLGCGLFLGLAAFLFRYYSGRKRECVRT